MRTAPGVCFTVARYRLWNLALLGLGSCAATILMVWVHRAIEAPWGALVAAVGALSAAALAASVRRTNAQVLRFDGQTWRLGPVGADLDRQPAAHVEVCIDLQFWLLLRLWPAAPRAGQQAAAWLPLERQGSAVDWHALRCAVYSASTLADVAASENRLTA